MPMILFTSLCLSSTLSHPPTLPPSLPFFFFCCGEEGGSEVEKDSFIALPDKGGHSGLMPSKPNVPTWGR